MSTIQVNAMKNNEDSDFEDFFDDFDSEANQTAGSSDVTSCEASAANCPPGSVIAIIAREISAIADDIEDLPTFGGGQLNAEQITHLQKIDFCSQRLKDLSALVEELSGEIGEPSGTLPGRMARIARLEHIRDLFNVG